jgi:hypothetical protein
MKILIALLLILAGCRSKYDTSNAIDILPTNEITIEYHLKDLPFQIDDEGVVASVSQGKKEKVSKVKNFVESVEHFEGKLFLATSKKIAVVSLRNSKEKTKEISVKHKISNPMLAVQKDFVLIFDSKGTFSVVNSSTLEEVWGGRVGLTDGEFLAEQKEKGLLETLNPKPPKQVVTMGSKFVCENEKCYAVTAEGILVVLDITKKQVQMAQVFPKQDIILNNLYKPIITNGNIIFATGNSEFAIFNIEKQAIIGQSTFTNEETASMFDINLVKEIYSSNGNVLISHLNGIYAFNVVQGRPLWNKNLHIDTALISGNYIIFFENKTQKLVCMHIATGEAKWIVPLNSKQTQVSFLQIVKNENDYSLFVGTKNGVEVLSFEDGSKKDFLKMNLGNVAYSFTHNEILYYINKSNIYKVK